MRAGFALVGVAILGLLVVRISSTPILLGRGHAAIAMLSPDDPAVVLDQTRRQFARQGQIDDESHRRILAVARQAPLAEDPFFFAALRTGENDRAQALRLLEEARRRNPRARLPRLLLVEQYVRAGRINEAAIEIKVLSRLVSDLSSLLVDQLSRLALDPQTRPALRRAIGNDPLLDSVLAALVELDADTATILEIATPRLRSYSPADPPSWQGALVRKRIAQGDYGAAARLWQRFNAIPTPPGTLYNPEFAAAPGGPPFNWELLDDASGVAERGRDGALEILYFGREDAELARQLMLLSPGRYRLQMAATSNDEAGGSRLAWRVSCAGGATLANLGLDELSSRARELRVDFEVPAGCPAQWIKLVGESAEFPTRREVQIRSMRLMRAGAAQ